MKRILTALAVLALSACSTGQLNNIQAAANVGCTVDGTFQPIAAGVLAAIPQTTAIATVDDLLVHPVVQAACAALGPTATPAVQIKPPAA